MKLRKIALTNVGCFLEKQELVLDGEMAILIGPNGGGKTTLVDTAIRALRKYLLVARFANTAGTVDAPYFPNWELSSEIQNSGFEKHRQGSMRPQKIELDVEITEADLRNIALIQRDLPELAQRSPVLLTSNPIGAPQEWNFEHLPPGTVFHYEVVDGSLSGMEANALKFASYLQFFDVHRQIRQAYNLEPLAAPIVYFPVRRHQGFQTEVQLSNSSISNVRRQSEGSHSKSGNAGLVELALQLLAERALFLHHQDHVDPIPTIKKEPGPSLLTEVLLAFGYTWDFKCTDRRNNTWGISFQKDGHPFLVGMASTGETEILYYALSITLLDIRDTLVAIDEPEMHLHPRAQRQLLSLFQKLNATTNNQFLFATHSPLFVTPESLRHVSRVASSKGASSITQIDPKGIPEGKKAFDLVNALNNEKIFFAEKVVLVEGSSDEIFFNALFRELGLQGAKDIEIVRVGGKHNFESYLALLKACNMPCALIADLDYLREIGSPDVKRLFTLQANRIKKCIDGVGGNKDGNALVEAIQKSIATKDVGHLEAVWKYVADRHTELTTPLEVSDQKLVDAFISQQRSINTFILQLGGLEMYLPPGHKSKDLRKLIELVADKDFLDRIFEPARSELERIARAAAS
ncbi:MAG: AAA family ATPase [Burkholderiaceae bacterium]|nr:AAA family ATPase [Burkholderiaceae bacterium]